MSVESNSPFHAPKPQCYQVMLETTAEVSCPYCGEVITLFLDLSVEAQTYIEDCSVCCQPMTVSYAVENGELASVSAESAG